MKFNRVDTLGVTSLVGDADQIVGQLMRRLVIMEHRLDNLEETVLNLHQSHSSLIHNHNTLTNQIARDIAVLGGMSQFTRGLLDILHKETDRLDSEGKAHRDEAIQALLTMPSQADEPTPEPEAP